MAKRPTKRTKKPDHHEQYAEKALELYDRYPHVDFDEDAFDVDVSDDGDGAWVQAWLFVPASAIGLKPPTPGGLTPPRLRLVN